MVDDDVSAVYSGASALALQTAAVAKMQAGQSYLAAWQSAIQAQLQADGKIGK